MSHNDAFGSEAMILMNAKLMNHTLFNVLSGSLTENKTPRSSKFV